MSTITPLAKAMIHLFTGKHCSSVAEGAFYYALLGQIGTEYEEGFPALAGVNKHGCKVNPEMFAAITPEQRVGVLAHEARHIYQSTMDRLGKSRDHRLYNIASDLVINEILAASGFSLPGGVRLNGIDGHKWPKEVQQKLKGFVVHETTEEQVYEWLRESGQEMPGAFVMDVEPGDGDATGQDARTKLRIAEACQLARTISKGDMPAWLEREIHDVLVEKTPWPEVIRDWMTSFAQSDLSWAKLDGIILANYRLPMPDFWSEAMGELVIVADTSGSITEDLLSEISAHISAGLAICCPQKVHVVYCDAAINATETLDSPTNIKLKPHGGGGTDFRPPFKWVKENAPNADGIIYFTDGYGEFPNDPGIKTLWCILKGCNKDVPFGRVVEID